MVVMNWDDKLKSITTGMTIEIAETTINCKSATVARTDQSCIKYLQQVAKKSNHIFVTSMSEFYSFCGKYKGKTKSRSTLHTFIQMIMMMASCMYRRSRTFNRSGYN